MRNNEGIFLAILTRSSRSYKLFNKRTSSIEESIHVIFNDSNQNFEKSSSLDDKESQNCQCTAINSKEVDCSYQLTNVKEK